jgi:hypothetical protein
MIAGQRNFAASVECVERDRLWGRYNEYLTKFTDAATTLETAVNSIVFAAEMMALKAAKDECVQARQDWESHLKTHQCDKATSFGSGLGDQRL